MQIFRNKSIIVLPGFCILVAVFLMLLPFQWVCAWFIASMVHELAHCVALSVCGVRIDSVKLGISGAVIVTEAIRPRHEVISAIAGPLGGLLLLLFLRFIPYIGICALVQSAFNLLPLYPLDGGRVFRCCVTHWFCVSTAEKICRYTENAVLLTLLLVSCIVSVYFKSGLLPVAASFLIFLKCKKIKIPCKRSEQIVQ